MTILADADKEGKLAEREDSAHLSIDQQFTATVFSLETKPDRTILHPALKQVDVLLKNPKDMPGTNQPGFRWIHLPANNVSHDVQS